MRPFLSACLLALLFLSACARPPATGPEGALEPVSWWWSGVKADDADFRGLADAVRRSLSYYDRVPPETAVQVGERSLKAKDIAETLGRFLSIVDDTALAADEKLRRINDGFELLRSTGSDGRGAVLVTGYYEPVLSCRIAQDETFRYPLYRRPDDMIEADLTQFGEGWPRSRLFGRLVGKRFVPYHSRQEIDQGQALKGKGLEVLWCSDPVDIYFLQVQGSGKADLGDGTVLSVLYDGANGRPYKGAGSVLAASGIIPKEEMSMQLIKQYLRDNPAQVAPVLNANQSYVFFRLDSGPALGNLGVPVTPGRSIATDTKFFPKGAVAVLKTERPVVGEDGTIREWKPFTRFVLNQDTGGAIKGPGRVDLFWGGGREAEIAAGHMKQEGELYFLLWKQEQ